MPRLPRPDQPEERVVALVLAQVVNQMLLAAQEYPDGSFTTAGVLAKVVGVRAAGHRVVVARLAISSSHCVYGFILPTCEQYEDLLTACRISSALAAPMN
ncbi:MAG: hypothetical protein U1A23_04640, partial [Candidatus Sungbacteria bacterium]|nr:hypothetical protein [Candidatus Sungbacteria bacterium]